MRRDAWTYAGARRVSRVGSAACRRSAVPLLGRRSSRWADRSRRPSGPQARRRARARGVRDPPRTGAHARRLRGRVRDARRRQCLRGGGCGVPLDDAGLRAKTQPHRTHGFGGIRVLQRRDLRGPSGRAGVLPECRRDQPQGSVGRVASASAIRARDRTKHRADRPTAAACLRRGTPTRGAERRGQRFVRGPCGRDRRVRFADRDPDDRLRTGRPPARAARGHRLRRCAWLCASRSGPGRADAPHRAARRSSGRRAFGGGRHPRRCPRTVRVGRGARAGRGTHAVRERSRTGARAPGGPADRDVLRRRNSLQPRREHPRVIRARCGQSARRFHGVAECAARDLDGEIARQRHTFCSTRGVAVHPGSIPLGMALPTKEPVTPQNGVVRIAFVASAVPRRCGIATFTADLMAAVKAADPAVRCVAGAIDEPNTAPPYGPDVRWRIKQSDKESYRTAARAINESSVDAVNLQHEFGLYGVWRDGVYDDHCVPFLESLQKPVITTLHTVLPQPEPQIRDVVRHIAERSTRVVVMAETAARLLGDVYGITPRPAVIQHGMPAIVPRGRHRPKPPLRVENRTILSTFGLVDPRKGLEYMIAAMPVIVARHPSALYLIVGQTHPELLKKAGEQYWNELVSKIEGSRMSDHVRFVNQYLTQREIVDYLLATDVYVTPYLDLNQITSGTLAYALGAGKAIVSTRYLHAAEALANGRGILVDVRDSDSLARSVGAILDDPAFKRELEVRAYEYGTGMAWPNVGQRVLALTRELIGRSEPPESEEVAEGVETEAILPGA